MWLPTDKKLFDQEVFKRDSSAPILYFAVRYDDIEIFDQISLTIIVDLSLNHFYGYKMRRQSCYSFSPHVMPFIEYDKSIVKKCLLIKLLCLGSD